MPLVRVPRTRRRDQKALLPSLWRSHSWSVSSPLLVINLVPCQCWSFFVCDTSPPPTLVGSPLCARALTVQGEVRWRGSVFILLLLLWGLWSWWFMASVPKMCLVLVYWLCPLFNFCGLSQRKFFCISDLLIFHLSFCSVWGESSMCFCPILPTESILTITCGISKSSFFFSGCSFTNITRSFMDGGLSKHHSDCLFYSAPYIILVSWIPFFSCSFCWLILIVVFNMGLSGVDKKKNTWAKKAKYEQASLYK